MNALDRPSWQNPKILTLLLFVFALGAVTGALGMRLGLHDRLHPNSTWNAHAAKAFLDRCDKELNLTPKQRAEMSSVLDDYKQYYEALEDVRSTGKRRIMALLDDQQRRRFEQMLNEPSK